MYLTEMVLREGPRPDIWVFAAPLVWEDATYGRLEVPEGFPTDLGSYPRILRSIPAFDPNGPSRKPAGTHDWLYGSKDGRRYGKEFADLFLYDACLSVGISPVTAGLIYYGVHWGGGPSWNADGRRLAQPSVLPPLPG